VASRIGMAPSLIVDLSLSRIEGNGNWRAGSRKHNVRSHSTPGNLFPCPPNRRIVPSSAESSTPRIDENNSCGKPVARVLPVSNPSPG
jgi:hypothetical protein